MRFACLKNLRNAGAAIVVLAGVLTAVPASAQTWGDLIVGAIKQGMINDAVKKWNAVDPDVRQCLVNSYGLNLNSLAQDTVTPDDYRLRNQMQSCRQAVAQARYQAELRRRAEEDRLAAERKAAEDVRIAQDLADKQAQIDRDAREAAAKVQAEIRHKNLIARFGSEQANAIENGRATVGMSKEAVREALGKPDNVESIPPDDEMWMYGSQRIAISRGKVTYVGH